MTEITREVVVEHTARNQAGDVFALNTRDPQTGTRRDVKVSRTARINLDQFAKGDRVVVTGSEKTEELKGYGDDFQPKTYRTLTLCATEITRPTNQDMKEKN